MDYKCRSAKNEISAPRIYVYTGFAQTSATLNPLNDIPISTTEQARERVRANAKKGAEGIKFFGAEPRNYDRSPKRE